MDAVDIAIAKSLGIHERYQNLENMYHDQLQHVQKLEQLLEEHKIAVDKRTCSWYNKYTNMTLTGGVLVQLFQMWESRVDSQYFFVPYAIGDDFFLPSVLLQFLLNSPGLGLGK